MGEVVKVNRGGGWRPNTGLRPGRVTSHKKLLTHELTRILQREGLLPLWIQQDNLHFFVSQYHILEQQYEALSPEEQDSREGRRLYQQVVTNRLIASDIANKMAPYIHPRLSAVAVKSQRQETLVVRFQKGDENI